MAMNLRKTEWAGALDLLDRALDLPASERAAWLHALGTDHAHLVPVVQRLLDERGAIETGQFLQALPALPEFTDARGGAFTMGQRIGPYALLRELGHGGMASVWLAERADGAHGREVALKLPYLGAHAQVIGARFARERQILSALTHPHVASVLDAGADGVQPWLAMEYVEGLPITEWATRQGLDVRARLRLFLQVLQAVSHAHAQLVIHRDIKPSNVLVDTQGQVKLLDFGVAKLLGDDGAAHDTELTQLGGRAFTPQYASPEQISGQVLGTASDVYSLGVLLFELLTDRLPYSLQRTTPAALEEAILAADIAPPSSVSSKTSTRSALRGDLDAIALKALARRPTERYPSCDAMAHDLRDHLAARPISARPAGWAYRLGRLLRRNRVAFGAGAAVLLATGVGLTATLWQAREAQAQARRAQAVSDFLNRLFAANSQRQADPVKAQQTTAAELLDLGAERIRSGFRDDPRTAQTLLQTVADLYIGMGRDDRGTQMLAERVDVVRRQLPGDSALLAEALVSYAGGLWETKQVPALRSVLQEAGALIEGLGSREPLTQGNWHFLRGDLRRTEDVAGAAVADYERALAWFDRAEREKPGVAEHRPHLLLSLTLEYQRAGRMADARATLQRGLQGVEPLATTDPTNAAMAWSTAGRFYIADAQFQQAETAMRRALDLYRHGGGELHPGVRITQVPMAQLQFHLGRRDEALALAQAAIEGYARQLGPGNPVTQGIHVTMARARQHLGDVTEARQTLEAAIGLLQQATGMQVRAAAATLELAQLFCAQRDTSACTAQLEQAERIAPQAFEKSERMQWQRYVLRARLAAQQDRWDVAAQEFESARALAARSSQVEPWERIWTLAELGADALQATRIDAATSLIEGAWAELQKDARLQPLRPLRAQILLRLGQLRLLQGRESEAAAALSEALEVRELTDVASSPWLAETRKALARTR